MHTRELGTSGLSVSALGLGCMGMSQSYGKGDDEESIRTIQRALDLGVTLVDPADAYARGANETLVGRAIGRRRQGVVLASKFGLVTNPSGPATDVDARPERVRASCEASLSRLGTDVIDLYYLHRVDPNVPIEDTGGGMSALGCEAVPQSTRGAHRIHPIAALQSEYSLWTRDPERAALPACRELGIGFVAFSPLGRGFLSGAVKDVQTFEPGDVRWRLPRFQSENLQKNIALVDRLEATARAK